MTTVVSQAQTKAAEATRAFAPPKGYDAGTTSASKNVDDISHQANESRTIAASVTQHPIMPSAKLEEKTAASLPATSIKATATAVTTPTSAQHSASDTTPVRPSFKPLCSDRRNVPKSQQAHREQNKTPARNTSEVATTQQRVSPKNSTQATANSKEITVMWKAALNRLTRFKKTLTMLEKVIQAEFVDLGAIDSAVKHSRTVMEDVTHNLTAVRELIEARSEQLDDATKRFRILTADDLAECTTQNLEDISDVLWAGLQGATLALSRRQDAAQSAGVEDFGKPSGNEIRAIEFATDSIPEANFNPAETPPLSSEPGKAEDLLNQLGTLLEGVRDMQSKTFKEHKALQQLLEQLQVRITAANKEYDTERTHLLSLEQQLDIRLRQVNRLTGRDSYDSLTTAQLTALCKTINKASRRLATEQAIREVRAQQRGELELSMSSSSSYLCGLKPGEDTEKCLVCFERNWDRYIDPCNHNLCTDCSQRLKFCPTCRRAIQGISLTPLEESKDDTGKKRLHQTPEVTVASEFKTSTEKTST